MIKLYLNAIFVNSISLNTKLLSNFWAHFGRFENENPNAWAISSCLPIRHCAQAFLLRLIAHQSVMFPHQRNNTNECSTVDTRFPRIMLDCFNQKANSFRLHQIRFLHHFHKHLGHTLQTETKQSLSVSLWSLPVLYNTWVRFTLSNRTSNTTISGWNSVIISRADSMLEANIYLQLSTSSSNKYLCTDSANTNMIINQQNFYHFIPWYSNFVENYKPLPGIDALKPSSQAKMIILHQHNDILKHI